MNRKRSGGLLTVVVVGIIIGSLGTCGGLFGLGGQLFESQMKAFSRAMLEASSGGNPEMVEQQLEMQERVEAVAAEWRGLSIAYQLVNLFASAALLAGAILLVRWSPSGPALFAGAALACVVIDLAGGALAVLMQLETSTILQEHMGQITGADPNLPASADRAMGAVVDASTNVGICFGVAWVLLKIGFYLFGIIYVRKAEVRSLFTASPL